MCLYIYIYVYERRAAAASKRVRSNWTYFSAEASEFGQNGLLGAVTSNTCLMPEGILSLFLRLSWC